MFLLIVVTVLLLTAGCGEGKNTEVKISQKANDTYILPKGMKLVNVTDKKFNSLGVTMRPMRANEKAETYTWCYLDGCRTVTIKETE